MLLLADLLSLLGEALLSHDREKGVAHLDTGHKSQLQDQDNLSFADLMTLPLEAVRMQAQSCIQGQRFEVGLAVRLAMHNEEMCLSLSRKEVLRRSPATLLQASLAVQNVHFL